MSAFYVAFIAVLLAGLGARDQATVAAISQRQRRRPGILLTGVIVSLATATFAAWAASFVVPLLEPLVAVVIALALAGLESLWPFTARRMEEPTASLGALGIVLLAHQITDASRFLIFALALAFAAPLAAGLGGALAGAVSLGLAWLLPEVFVHGRLRLVRQGIGALLLLIATVLFFEAITR
jgi:Ca2+/H+ antiporter, TMEM165/GDT1 family